MKSTLWLLLACFALSGAARAQDPAAIDPALAAKIASHLPGGKPDTISVTPVPGLYEVRRGAEVVYVTGDGLFGFTGDLYNLVTKVNLSDDTRRTARLALLSEVPESRMVVFGPDTAKYTVTVFTDVDCGYCQRLHRQIADYNRDGIRVRYLFYPRSGPQTESWFKAEQVWCSTDRRDALTRAKLGEALAAKRCADNPVAQHYALGQAMGLEGTPGIVLANGDLVPGYLPPDSLLARLEQKPAAAPR